MSFVAGKSAAKHRLETAGKENLHRIKIGAIIVFTIKPGGRSSRRERYLKTVSENALIYIKAA
jgi:hypothetical protein